MPTPPSDETKQLFKLLAGGGWQLYEDIRDRLALTIAPGRALRRYEQNLEYKRRYRSEENYDTSLNEDDRIFYGQRMLAQGTITSWKGKGIDFTGDGRDEPKRIRLKPGFTTWGFDIEAPDELDSDKLLDKTLDNEITPDEESELEKAVENDVNEEIKSDPAQQPDVEVPDESAQEPDPDLEYYGVAPEAVSSPVGPDSFAGLLDHVQAGLGAEDYVPTPFIDTCDQCGLFVSNQLLHDDFHKTHPAQKSSDEMALLDRSEVSHLIEQVVSEQLDAFQGGMQTYLAGHFQQLESLISIAMGMPWRASGASFNRKH